GAGVYYLPRRADSAVALHLRDRRVDPSFQEHLSKLRMSFHRKPERDVGFRPGCVLRTPSREYREASLLERTGWCWPRGGTDLSLSRYQHHPVTPPRLRRGVLRPSEVRPARQ